MLHFLCFSTREVTALGLQPKALVGYLNQPLALSKLPAKYENPEALKPFIVTLYPQNQF